MLRRLPVMHYLSFAGISFAILAHFFAADPALSAKAIEKNMVKVNDTLYACRYETSNADYRRFLYSLRETDPQSYSRYGVDSTGWEKVFSYQQPMVLRYFSHPAYADYPVVNISYEGAEAYCKWLTGVYNHDPKRKFSKVLFHLPDTTQWMQAARGGKGNVRYPWGTYSLRDKQGGYMCNLRRLNEELVVTDSLGGPMYDGATWSNHLAVMNGAFYTDRVASFLPNSIGLYNVSGNAAEMTVEKGITKGGCWNSFGGEVTIAAIKGYDLSSPEVGFRVFMTVVEP